MSAVESRVRALRGGVERTLNGWGSRACASCLVLRPQDTAEVEDLLSGGELMQRGVIARGAGRSYGDAAQNDGGAVLDMTAMQRIIAIDSDRGTVVAQAGATVAQLLVRLAGHGLTLPVVPGTRHVTLAGAIASDVHGKNHHRDGAFARHVLAIVLCTPAGGLVEVTPESDPGLFYATLGGMGLTGVIVQATVRAEALSTPWVAADLDRTDGLEQTLQVMAGGERHRYSVAWLDLLADGAKMGRAIVSRADPLHAGARIPAARGRRAAADAYPDALLRRPPEVPARVPSKLLQPVAVRALNALRWRAAPRRERGRPLAMVPYFFPLDGLGAWNRLYGREGLIQYQFVVPMGEEQVLQRCFELIRARRLPVYLAVFKRFGPAFGGALSFPLQGWTLAVDVPAGAPGLEPALSALDELIAGCGGRVYLSKDVRLRREHLQAMYPEIDRFRDQRSRVDPQGILRSDLARRLGLCEARA
jgi:decaprenylphospho-beta-D-ribofuranose 2-oxidase